MKKRCAWLPSCFVALTVAACGSGEATDEMPDGGAIQPDLVDVRVEIPAPNERFFDIVSPEVTIQSGDERMYCFYAENTGPDMAIRNLQMLQGPGGHHIALIEPSTDAPAGTLLDCTEAESPLDMIPLAIPVPLPARHGISIPSGKRFVMQFHYINVDRKPILVRDVARLERIELADVDEWVSTFATNDVRFEIPAGETATRQWDCQTDRDMEIIFIGGHMHEWGKSFSLEAGDGVNMDRLWLVRDWLPDFRDTPPLGNLSEAPRVLPAGTVLRTRCEWDNTTSRALRFPEEMCVAFGYIRSTDAYLCGDIPL